MEKKIDPFAVMVGGVKVGEIPEKDGNHCNSRCPGKVGDQSFSCQFGLGEKYLGRYVTPGFRCPRHPDYVAPAPTPDSVIRPYQWKWKGVSFDEKGFEQACKERWEPSLGTGMMRCKKHNTLFKFIPDETRLDPHVEPCWQCYNEFEIDVTKRTTTPRRDPKVERLIEAARKAVPILDDHPGTLIPEAADRILGVSQGLERALADLDKEEGGR